MGETRWGVPHNVWREHGGVRHRILPPFAEELAEPWVVFGSELHLLSAAFLPYLEG